MSNPATGSFYGVVTFVVLGGAFVWLTNAVWGWTFPSPDRLKTSLTVLYFLAVGGYALLVGKHRDVGYVEALRRGAIDVGRKLKGMVMR